MIKLSDDEELELWKRKRLLEMRKRLLIKRAEETAEKGEAGEKRAGGPREALNSVFVGRAWEVWRAAEQQYPSLTSKLEAALAELIRSGRLRGPVSGEELYWLFRRLGVMVRLETRIRILERGELKSIAEKLREA